VRGLLLSLCLAVALSGAARADATLRRLEDVDGAFRIDLPPAWSWHRDLVGISAVSPQREVLVRAESSARSAADLKQLSNAVRTKARATAGMEDYTVAGEAPEAIAGTTGLHLRAIGVHRAGSVVFDAWMVLTPRRQHVLTVIHPLEPSPPLAAAIVEVVRGWLILGDPPVDRPPLVRVQNATGDLEVRAPGTWQARYAGRDLLVTAPDGSAQIVGRVGPRRFPDLDAFEAAILAGMGRRGEDVNVVKRGTGQISGHAARMLLLRDRRAGRPWLHVVGFFFREPLQVTFVLSAYEDPRGKGEALLDALSRTLEVREHE
jgi:hypothetical protein